MSDTEKKPPDFYNKKSRLLMFIPLVIIVIGGLVAGIFVIPMFEANGENKQVTIGEVTIGEPKLLSQSEGIELGLNQNDEILLKMDKIIEEQEYQRQLLEEIYDMES